ncbi:MAG: hypothetical protein HYV63_31095 [Candidatus Schekmanbacteria bacterium]|nr:hypothetical protein [Candidatus Schekmanbacteria bacterium]
MTSLASRPCFQAIIPATLALLLAFSATDFCAAASSTFYGDLGYDGKVNVVDVQCLNLVVLWHASLADVPPPTCLAGPRADADLNCDNELSFIDMIIEYRLALEGKLPAEIDADQDGVHDACNAVFES